MFGKKKDNGKIDEAFKEEVRALLSSIENEQRRLATVLDAINDTIAEHFEGVEDIGEITKHNV